MREGGGRDTNVNDFLFVIPICLFVAFESMSKIAILFYFKPSREDSSNWTFHQFKMPPTTHQGLTHY